MLIPAKLCLVVQMLTANRKNTLLGVDACPVSKKTVERELAFHSARIFCAEKMPSVSSHPPLLRVELRPPVLAWKVTTEIRSLAVLAFRMSAQLHCPVRSLKSVSLDVVRSDVKA